MASDTPPQNPPRLLSMASDADFGEMRLVSQPFHAMVTEEEGWQEDALTYWEGALSGIEFKIYVDEPGEFPDVPVHVRRMFLKLAANEAEMRREVAASMLELAKEWADAAELDEPNEESFFAAIELATIDTYDDWRPTLWFQEIEADPDLAIFAGHVIEVRCDEKGMVEEMVLAG